MNACELARTRFSEALDGMLAPDAAQELEAHLGGCEACREAWASYRETFETLGACLHRLVDHEVPVARFPQAVPAPPGGRGARWRGALGLVAAAVAGVVVGSYLPRAWNGWIRGASAPGAALHASRGCPWRTSPPEEIHEQVSYPVVTDTCLGEHFELVEAAYRGGGEAGGEPCPESVRLTYRAGHQSLVLEQRTGVEPVPCAGEPVTVAGRLEGCLVHLAQGLTTLDWSLRSQRFRLEGDVARTEALQVARDISEGFETN